MFAEAVTPRLASTILLLRDATGTDEIEVFMMVRHYEIDFNSGALVFPGGSVDKGDQEIIARPELYSAVRGSTARVSVSASPRSAKHSRKAASCWPGRADRKLLSMPSGRGRSKPAAAP